MLKTRLLSLIMAAAMILPLGASVSAADGDAKSEPVVTPVAEADRVNLIENGDFSAEPVIEPGVYEANKKNTWFGNAGADTNGNTYVQKITWSDGMLVFGDRTKNTRFFYYNGDNYITPGTYTFSFKVKTATEGEKTNIRYAISGIYTEKTPIGINDKWQTITHDFTVEQGQLAFKFELYGGTSVTDIHSFCFDDFTLIRTGIVEPPPVDTTVPLSIKDTPEGNVIVGFESLSRWNTSTQKIRLVEDDNGSYLECSKLITNYHGFKFTPEKTVPAGKYHFTGYIRMMEPGEVTQLRLRFYDTKNNSILVWAYPVSNSWLKIDTYITLENNLNYIHVGGGPSEIYMQEYCLDAFSLVPVDKIPDGGFVDSFGTPVSAAEVLANNKTTINEYDKYDKEAEGYEIQGVIINQDADSFIGSCVGCTEQQIIDFAKMYRDTHVTDFVICLNNTNVTYPSDVWNDLLDKYYQKTENGKPVDYSNVAMMKGAHHVFEVLGTDYIALWMDAFREVDINPWISIRMNDAHDIGNETSHLLSDYWHNNPQIRRVQNGSKLAYGGLADYTYRSHRDHVLALVDEALSRYDCYGLELDFQRQMYFWYYGGEYNGIDIMNEFMREVDAIVAKYEEKYGHEIKLNVCVGHDIQTNYDFGFDVLTWAEEGIIDMVTPKGMNVQQNDVPVAHWKSMLEPYGTLVAPGIDMWLGSYTGSSTSNYIKHDLETFSAAAANFLSQGADRIYMYNYYLGLGNKITDADRITTTDNELSVQIMKGYHNVITTLGSYDKLMRMNRRMQITFSDTKQVWKEVDNQIPKNIMQGKSLTLHMPVGDIPEGADVTLRISSSAGFNEGKYPTIKINGIPCSDMKVTSLPTLTTDPVLAVTVPKEAFDDMYITAEITAAEYMNITFTDVYIKAPENATAPKKASSTPSDWAVPEVDAAIKAGILPWAMRYDYTDKVTRSEFCTLIMAMINKAAGVDSSRELLTKLGIDYVDCFSDTDSADVIAASLIGIVNGRGNGIFDPMSGITRQEAAKMLASAAGLLGIKKGTAPEFTDIDKAADWAVESVKTTASIVSASGKNVMGGVGAGKFDPLGAYTKEQSVLTVYRLYDSIKGEVNIAVDAKALAAPENARYIKTSPADVKPEGVSGIVLRASSDEIDVSKLGGTQVTDVILTLGKKDATDVIKAIRANGIRVYVSVNSGMADKEAESILKKYDVNGIEVDYLTGFDVIDFGNTYKNLDEETEMLTRLAAVTDKYAAKRGHSVRVSVRVASDVMTNYYLGLDLTEWARNGLVDMICPSSLNVNDSDISVRLWYSLFDAYDVVIAPVIGETLKTRSIVKTSYEQNFETLAGYAMEYLSKGAHKVSVYYSSVDSSDPKVLGSYETLLNAERRTPVTYTDARTPWQKEDSQLQMSFGKGGYDVAYIPVGDVAKGDKAYVRIAFVGHTEENRTGLTVYVNSELCKYSHFEEDALTGLKLYSFEIPETALNKGTMFVETRGTVGAAVIEYIEFYVK